MYNFFPVSYTVITVMTVDLLATSGDMTLTWTSPILPKLYRNDSSNPLDRPIDPGQDSWIGSLMNIGAMLGPFPYGFIAEKFGRKIGLLCIAVPHIVSYLTLAFSNSVYWYYFARLLGGVALGGGYTLLPMYLAEISEDSNRGMFSATLNIFWTFGNLVPYVIGPYTPVLWFNIILACVPATFFVLFLMVAPESPYYLLVKNQKDRAEKSLMTLRSHKKSVVDKEIEQIQAEIAQNDDQVTFWDFLKTPIYRKGLFISVTMLILSQLSGINAVLFYTQDIFANAGSDVLSPEISSIIIGLVIFSSSFGTPFVADRWGRRILMLISITGVTVAHVVFGFFFFLKKSMEVDVSSFAWLPIVSLVSYIVSFNVGLGPLPFVIASELFPTNVKSYAATLSACACWTTSFFVTKFFGDLQKSLGEGETFWLFGGFCFVSWFFTMFFIPETKEKSFQEIQEILEKW